MSSALSPRRTFVSGLSIAFLGTLIDHRRLAARPIEPQDEQLNAETGKKLGNYVFASRFAGSLGRYRITNRIVNKTKDEVRVEYRAAFLYVSVPPNEVVEDESNFLLIRPISSALVPGVSDEVIVYTKGSFVTKTTANAYIPPARVAKWGAEALPKGVEWTIDQAGKVVRIITSLRRSPGLTIVSELRPAGDNFSYMFRAYNADPEGAYFHWTSLLKPGTDGWRAKVPGREWSEPLNFIESGPPVVITDVLALNRKGLDVLPKFDNLKAEPNLARRRKDLDNLSKTDINSILLAPAIVPSKWL